MSTPVSGTELTTKETGGLHNLERSALLRRFEPLKEWLLYYESHLEEENKNLDNDIVVLDKKVFALQEDLDMQRKQREVADSPAKYQRVGFFKKKTSEST
jgi:hypothetical protein